MSQDPYRYPPSPIGLPPAGTTPTGAPPAPPSAPPPAGSPGDSDDIQFDRAEAATPASPAAVAGFQTPPAAAASACAVCARPISDYYFEANGKVLCPACQQAVAASQTGGSGFARLAKAMVFGIVAGLLGAAVWWAVGHFFNIHSGLIAVLIGFMVGGAVRVGSNQRGGIGYQLIAVLITYLSVGAALIIGEVTRPAPQTSDGPPSTLAVVLASIVFSVIGPILGAIASPILGIIIAFALWEAWKINSKQTIVFNGPYRVGQPGGPPGVPGMAPAGGAPPLYPPPPPGAWPPPSGGA